MKWETKIVEKKSKILIINQAKNKIADEFKNFLDKLPDTTIYFLTTIVSSFEKFDYVFIFYHKKINFINNKKRQEKIIYYQGNLLDQKSFDRILWFCLSSSSVKILHLILPKIKEEKSEKNKERSFFFLNFLHLIKKKPIIIVILTIFLLNSFLIFILSSQYLFYLTFKSISTNPSLSKKYQRIGEKFLFYGKKIYQLPRPLYLFLGIGIFSDNLVEFTEEVNYLLINIDHIKTTSQKIFDLFNCSPKTLCQTATGKTNIDNLNYLLDQIEKNLLNINQKAPFFVENNQKYRVLIKEFYSLIGITKKITKKLDKILGAGGKKKYLILFANNRELRPGGGFIGSFAILELEYYVKKSFKIYDVYDADGQLKIHIEPPEPIKIHLSQPHWFLRDSAFSSDFEENFKTVEFFLEKELDLRSFDGGILLTTSAVENILKAFGDIYLPDYKEKINSNNFYLKTQLYTEKNFFPGSIQKKSFLNSLSQQIFINFNQSSLTKLIKEVKQSLDEKQIVLYFKDEDLQKIINSLLWSGKLVFSECVIKNYHCLNNYFFPFDANLGVNKADYFVNKSIFLRINVNSNGKITNYLTLNYSNDSPFELFPGGIYKNFFQIYLPKSIDIKLISKDNVVIENYDKKEEKEFYLISFYFELKPKKTTEIKIIFENQSYLTKGKNVFQIVIQKQIGALNKDFILEINFPKNISIINNNFLPLVKNNKIVYNGILTTDKIYYLILNRQ